MSQQAGDEHRFQQDSGMTFEEVYQFAIGRFFPLIRNLAGELDREDFIELLQKAASDSAAAEGRKRAERLPQNDFEAWTSSMREPNRLWKGALSVEIVEDTEKAFEVKITECLWAKIFRKAGGAEIGYAAICHPDYAICQAFNPKIRMIRSKTLMQGDDYCNHRWVWED